MSAAQIPKPAPFFIPSLDGIRAISVMIVFISHLREGLLPGTFGVTVFFFLSGYLITTLMRREYVKNDRINLKHFYLRRVLRILPPMFLTYLVVILLTVTGVINGVVERAAVLFQVGFLTNYFVIANGTDSVPPGTNTLWSLAVEEHFYMVFPLACILLFPRLSFKNVSIIFLVTCLAVLAWRIVLVTMLDASPDRTLLATDTRIDSILVGCAMGLWFNPMLDKRIEMSRSVKLGLIGLALATIGFTVVWKQPLFREAFRHTLQGIALLPLFYIAITEPRWGAIRALSWAPMRRIGLYSYTLYLCHLSVFKGIRTQWPGASLVVVGVLGFVISMLFSAAMYRWVDKPCAGLRKRLHESDTPKVNVST